MGLTGASFIVYGVAGLGLGGLTGLAFGLSTYHARCSRISGDRLDERGDRAGPALLGGIVAEDEDQGAEPVLSVEARTSQRRQRRTARPFSLALPSGARVRVEPEEGRWSLDATFLPTGDGYQAEIAPGDEIYVRGSLQRGTDPRAAGHGYRDAARAWVMRGDLTFHSTRVIAAHAARASFHRTWAAALAALSATLHAAFWATSIPESQWASSSAALALLALVGAGFAYWHRAEATVLWVRRTVTLH